MAILTTSLIFTMIPSALVGCSQVIGLSLFKNLGPFYTFCLLCAGVLNFIIDITLNVQIKRATVACLKGKSDIATPIPTISPTVHVYPTSQYTRLYR